MELAEAGIAPVGNRSRNLILDIRTISDVNIEEDSKMHIASFPNSRCREYVIFGMYTSMRTDEDAHLWRTASVPRLH